MKPTLMIATAAFILSTFAAAVAEDPTKEKAKALMQVKLKHSKSLLESLATGDFQGLAKHSDALTVLSLETDWNVIQTAEYRRLSDDFRRSTRSVTESAKAENLDGATLAYVGLTVKCIECHKYVRGVQVGQTGR